jgi:folate-dependent phosphoribosylglycinamide formyltransferase PurN
MTVSGPPIVLLATDGLWTRCLYRALVGEFDVRRVILERPVSRAFLLWRRARRLGMGAALGQLTFLLSVPPALRVVSRKRQAEILSRHGLDARPIPEEVISRVDSANSSACATLLKGLETRVVVVCGTRILSRTLLESVGAAFVNLHAGITPRYRGVHGGYWALVEGEPQACGVTVHLVNPGIDTGGVLHQAPIEPTSRDCFVTYPVLQLAAGVPILKQAVRELLEKSARAGDGLPGPSRLRYHPTLGQYLRGWLRHGVR